MGGAVQSTWDTPAQAMRIVTERRNLARTLVTATMVGTVLFAINQLDTVLAGRATSGTWIKIGVTYLVPFVVANVGVLLASHRHS